MLQLLQFAVVAFILLVLFLLIVVAVMVEGLPLVLTIHVFMVTCRVDAWHAEHPFSFVA